VNASGAVGTGLLALLAASAARQSPQAAGCRSRRDGIFNVFYFFSLPCFN